MPDFFPASEAPLGRPRGCYASLFSGVTYEALPRGKRWPHLHRITVTFGERLIPEHLEGQGGKPHQGIGTVFVTDTVNASHDEWPQLQVVSVAPVFTAALQ